MATIIVTKKSASGVYMAILVKCGTNSPFQWKEKYVITMRIKQSLVYKDKASASISERLMFGFLK